MFTALSIAGSDPTGGAGLELDLKVFQHFGVHGMAVATALTVQDADRVHAAGTLPSDVVLKRLDVLLKTTTPSVVKLGMLGTGEVADGIASRLLNLPPEVPVVLDPVILSSSGACLLDDQGVLVMRERILRRATIVCPNRAEARRLTLTTIDDPGELARALVRAGAAAACVTGGDVGGTRADDHFCDGRADRVFSAPRTPGESPHGTGCAFAAAIAASLAHGAALMAALNLAKRFITEAVRTAAPLPPGPLGRTERRVLHFSGPPAVS